MVSNYRMDSTNAIACPKAMAFAIGNHADTSHTTDT